MPDPPDSPPPQVIRVQPVSVNMRVGAVTVWLTYSFAPEWFADAVSEANASPSHGARRREVLFAVCCAESYLVEWVRDEVLKRDFSKLEYYFPIPDRRGIRDRWKDVTKQLSTDQLISAAPGFGDTVWANFRDLVAMRDGLVHGNSSRPETAKQPDERNPMPSKSQLDGLAPGWAVNTVISLIRALHAAVGSPAPAWLQIP